MLIQKPLDIKSSQITDKKVYLDRRRFLAAAASLFVSGLAGLSIPEVSNALDSQNPDQNFEWI